jgi:class 3 adenylate cyclase
VLGTHEVREACGDGVRWEHAGTYELRGIAEPVPALRAVR